MSVVQRGYAPILIFLAAHIPHNLGPPSSSGRRPSGRLPLPSSARPWPIWSRLWQRKHRPCRLTCSMCWGYRKHRNRWRTSQATLYSRFKGTFVLEYSLMVWRGPPREPPRPACCASAADCAAALSSRACGITRGSLTP